MKTKKVIVGAVAAAMLSLSVCSLAPVMAADETVQISVGTATAEPGASFTVDVSLADIPAAGIQGCEFSIEFDNSLITVDSVTAGSLANTGADSADGSAAQAPIFESAINNDEGLVNLMWSTALTDASYWLKDGGVFCTITGTVAADAANGTTAELKVAATKHETYPGSGTVNTVIKAGYVGSDNVAVNYAANTTNGAVNISAATTTTTTTAPPVDSGLKGDANCNNLVEVADAVFILQGIADPSNELYMLTAQGKLNADVDGSGAADPEDAVQIQLFKADMIPEL